VTLFMPQGVIGLIGSLKRRLSDRKGASE